MSFKKTVTANGAPKAIGPYSHAVSAGNFLYTSGQLGIEASTGNLVEGGVQAQTRTALENLGKVLSAGGCGYQDVVKTLVFLKDMNDFAEVNAIYAEFFPQEPPARSAVQVAALPKGALVEIEAVASIPD